MRPTLRLWLIRKLIRPMFHQGPQHESNTIILFAEIRKAWAEEFIEDTLVAQNFHLTYLWHKSEEKHNDSYS